jgi:hypothetical protein
VSSVFCGLATLWGLWKLAFLLSPLRGPRVPNLCSCSYCSRLIHRSSRISTRGLAVCLKPFSELTILQLKQCFGLQSSIFNLQSSIFRLRYRSNSFYLDFLSYRFSNTTFTSSPSLNRTFYSIAMPESVWFCVSPLALIADKILIYLQPSCGFGPLNPHIDAACANCGWYPGRPRRARCAVTRRHCNNAYNGDALKPQSSTVSLTAATIWGAEAPRPSTIFVESDNSDSSKRTYTTVGLHDFAL